MLVVTTRSMRWTLATATCPTAKSFGELPKKRRIVITFDLDFGDIASAAGDPATSVILLRLKRARTPIPGAALHVLGGVEPDAEDPGPQVLDVRQAGTSPPALEERLLGGVLGVVPIAQEEQERAHQLVAQFVERGQ